MSVLCGAAHGYAAGVFRAEQLEAAARRLRGQIVHTPLIGGLHLPGFTVAPELRIKPEVLQPSGSIHARGAMHCLMRRLGQPKGIVAAGEPRLVLAAAWAAAMHRMPAVACLAAPVDPDVERLLAGFGCEAVVAGDQRQAEAAARGIVESRGFLLLPGIEDPDYALGIASIAVELAADLADDCTELFVAPASVGAAVEAGLRALGRSLRRHTAEPLPGEHGAALMASVAIGQRLCIAASSAAALACALARAEGAGLVVLGE